jgi:hypothetical protein
MSRARTVNGGLLPVRDHGTREIRPRRGKPWLWRETRHRALVPWARIGLGPHGGAVARGWSGSGDPEETYAIRSHKCARCGESRRMRPRANGACWERERHSYHPERDPRHHDH